MRNDEQMERTTRKSKKATGWKDKGQTERLMEQWKDRRTKGKKDRHEKKAGRRKTKEKTIQYKDSQCSEATEK